VNKYKYSAYRKVFKTEATIEKKKAAEISNGTLSKSKKETL
jgi:hypothetical protein